MFLCHPIQADLENTRKPQQQFKNKINSCCANSGAKNNRGDGERELGQNT